ncbi:unnamed protein product [Effrenium voratum]|nr:unnamed protein product [Effrenium voratum]
MEGRPTNDRPIGEVRAARARLLSPDFGPPALPAQPVQPARSAVGVTVCRSVVERWTWYRQKRWSSLTIMCLRWSTLIRPSGWWIPWTRRPFFPQALYQAVLKFIGDKGVGSSWEFQAGPGAPERLRCLPGLGVHSVHRLGDVDAVATVHLEKGPRRQIVAFLPFEKRLEAKSLLSQFFEMCLAHSNVKAVSDTVREEAEAQGGKWWVQELVEQAIREQEAEEGKEDTANDADPDRWSELKPDEAEKRGARRLGLDFDPLGPA